MCRTKTQLLDIRADKSSTTNVSVIWEMTTMNRLGLYVDRPWLEGIFVLAEQFVSSIRGVQSLGPVQGRELAT
jgi:hypothetical protein